MSQFKQKLVGRLKPLRICEEVKKSNLEKGSYLEIPILTDLSAFCIILLMIKDLQTVLFSKTRKQKSQGKVLTIF